MTSGRCEDKPPVSSNYTDLISSICKHTVEATSSPSRNTNPVIPNPPDVIIPLPLLQRLMHALHISLTLLRSRDSRGPACLLSRNKGLSGAPILVGGDVL
ncbi:hypothetical protein ACHAPA_001372 [Fusarium lateritium]